MMDVLNSLGRDALGIGVALLVLISFEPPRGGLGWLRTVVAAVGCGLAAGQVVSLFDWTRTARTVTVGAAAFFGDGLVEVGLRLRAGLKTDPIGMLKTLFKLRAGRIEDIPDDVLKGTDKKSRRGE